MDTIPSIALKNHFKHEFKKQFKQEGEATNCSSKDFSKITVEFITNQSAQKLSNKKSVAYIKPLS